MGDRESLIDGSPRSLNGELSAQQRTAPAANWAQPWTGPIPTPIAPRSAGVSRRRVVAASDRVVARAPAPLAPVGLGGARRALADVDAQRHRARAHHLDRARRRLFPARPIADLADLPAAPAPDGAALEPRAGVEVTGANLHRGPREGDAHRLRPVLRGAVAELPAIVLAPAEDLPRLRACAGELGAEGDLDDAPARRRRRGWGRRPGSGVGASGAATCAGAGTSTVTGGAIGAGAPPHATGSVLVTNASGSQEERTGLRSFIAPAQPGALRPSTRMPMRLLVFLLVVVAIVGAASVYTCTARRRGSPGSAWRGRRALGAALAGGVVLTVASRALSAGSRGACSSCSAWPARWSPWAWSSPPCSSPQSTPWARDPPGHDRARLARERFRCAGAPARLRRSHRRPPRTSRAAGSSRRRPRSALALGAGSSPTVRSTAGTTT